MKMFPTIISSGAIALLVATAALPANAEGENVGDTQRCVYLPRIDSSPVINDTTILVEMRAKGQYKRIDLRSPCSGLKFHGFSVRMHNDRLCKSDALVVRREAGNSCMIQQIVTIDEEEALALKASR